MGAGAIRVVLLAACAVVAAAAPAAGGTLTVTYAIQGGGLYCCPQTEPTPVAAVGGHFTWRMPAVGSQTLGPGATATLLAFEVVGATTWTWGGGGSGANVGAQLVSAPTFQRWTFGGQAQTVYSFVRAGLPSFRVGRSFSLGPYGYVQHYLRAKGIGGATATLHWQFCCTSYSYSFMAIDVTGQEVARVFAPEPRTAPLLALGLVAVAAPILVRARRRRTVR